MCVVCFAECLVLGCFTYAFALGFTGKKKIDVISGHWINHYHKASCIEITILLFAITFATMWERGKVRFGGKQKTTFWVSSENKFELYWKVIRP